MAYLLRVIVRIVNLSDRVAAFAVVVSVAIHSITYDGQYSILSSRPNRGRTLDSEVDRCWVVVIVLPFFFLFFFRRSLYFRLCCSRLSVIGYVSCTFTGFYLSCSVSPSAVSVGAYLPQYIERWSS